MQRQEDNNTNRKKPVLPQLTVFPCFIDVIRFPPGLSSKAFAMADRMSKDSLFLSVSSTSEETSIVIQDKHVDAYLTAVDAPSDTKIEVERDWRMIKVEGPLDFSLIGILSLLSTVLAKAGVSIFALSTYDTDYILVKNGKLMDAERALSNAGYPVRRKSQ